MPAFNKVIIAGNITRAPEMRYTPKGTCITKIGVAINRAWTDDTGKKREEVTFIDADFFGKTAETIAQYLRKGSPILFEGRLKLDQWDDKKTGEKKQRLGIVGESFSFVGDSKDGGNAQSPAKGKRARNSAPTNDVPAAQDGDDVPF